MPMAVFDDHPAPSPKVQVATSGLLAALQHDEDIEQVDGFLEVVLSEPEGAFLLLARLTVIVARTYAKAIGLPPERVLAEIGLWAAQADRGERDGR